MITHDKQERANDTFLVRFKAVNVDKTYEEIVEYKYNSGSN